MTAVEYSKLSRPQKIAALLIVAGPEAAAEVLRPFPDAEVEEICQLMGGFEVISQEFRDHLIEEFEPLIIGGLILGAADIFGSQRRNIEQTGMKDAIVVGVAQALALIPGVSRSGATITGDADAKG